jgi:hypothetical protein
MADVITGSPPDLRVSPLHVSFTTHRFLDIHIAQWPHGHGA